jgi:hypothetical protein
MAGRTTLYHHAKAPFYKSMKNITRARHVDPTQHSTTDFGPMLQDIQNYLQQSSHLSPGCRLECGYAILGSQNEGMNAATSAGVRLRKFNEQEVLTVSYHEFLIKRSFSRLRPPASRDPILL